MSKKILITGGPGFIGHQVVKRLLLDTDYEILIMDRLSYAGNLNRLNKIIIESGEENRSRISFMYYDLKASFNKDVIKRIEDINIILHIAASSHVTNSVETPSIFIQDNIVGTFNLLEAARKVKDLELFYYFSTDEVFGPSDDDSKFNEWDRFNSRNPYSASKASGEELTIAYSNTYSVPSLITHCCNVYGQRQHSEKFIPNTIKKIMANQEIVIHTDANNLPGSRYYLYNEDLAKSIVFLVKNQEEARLQSVNFYKKDPAKINISGDSLITNLEVVEFIGELMEKKPNFKFENKDITRPGHDVKYGLNNNLIKTIGGHFDRDFKDGIDDVVTWYKNNPHWV